MYQTFTTCQIIQKFTLPCYYVLLTHVIMSLIGSCPGNIYAQSSITNFYSPNYPSSYPHNEDCYWLIEAPSGHIIYVYISYFHLESGGSSCPYDYLEIYDGSSSSSSLLYKSCGHQSAWSFSSSSQYLYFRFHTDGSVTDTGFAAECQAVADNSKTSIVFPFYTYIVYM